MDYLTIAALIGALFLIPTAYAGLIGAPWAPTRMAAVKKAFDDIGVGESDYIVDLGAGDAAILREAASRGAHAVGYELSPIMWIVGALRSLGNKRISMQYGNFFRTQLPKNTTLVFLFLMPKHMGKVGEYIAKQKLADSCLVLSYAFPFKGIGATRTYREKKCAPLYMYELSAIRASLE